MSELQERITEIRHGHCLMGFTTRIVCRCGDQFDSYDAHDQHVAALIAQAAEEHYRGRIEPPDQNGVWWNGAWYAMRRAEQEGR